MARPAPAATRAIEVLNFLAERPLEFFTLSEIARSLDINAASAHALLSALTDAGYLTRHPTHKTYRLGLAVVGLGAAALESNPVVTMARAELIRLSETLGHHIVATTRIGAEIMVVERAGIYIGDDPVPRAGHRLPMAPPRGSVFISWSTPADIEAWVATTPAEWSNHDPHALRDLIAETRKQGYAVVHSGEIGSEGQLNVNNIAAPVFGSYGQVVLAISAHGFSQPLSRHEVETIGETLRKSGLGLTNETHGRMP